ncbi:MAG TPA: preprotein translocase subunit YajC [Pengzhenrongella sp.]
MDPSFIIIIVLAFGAMWFMSNRTRKQQRAAGDFRANLEVGQEVMTGSGLFGTIVAVDGDEITLESTPGNQTRWIRAAVSKLVPRPVVDDDEADEDEDDDDSFDDFTEDDFTGDDAAADDYTADDYTADDAAVRDDVAAADATTADLTVAGLTAADADDVDRAVDSVIDVPDDVSSISLHKDDDTDKK